MKTIGTLFKILFFVTWLGGWALALSAVHVVRTPDKVIVVPKDRLSFSQTYTDIRQWTLADVEANRQLSARLIATDKAALLENLPPAPQEQLPTPAVQPLHEAPIAPTATPEPRGSTIFD